jgi:hypothetical protein
MSTQYSDASRCRIYSLDLHGYVFLHFITCQVPSRFGEIPSQTHIWDEGVLDNHTKTLVNSKIDRLDIIVSHFSSVL